MTETAIVTRSVTDVERFGLDPQALISTALEKSASVETMERLFALAKDVQAQRARSAWYAAMAEFQRTCPTIKKAHSAKIVTKGGGSYGYSFASLDDIMSAILPPMGKLGLSVSYRVKHESGQVIAVARVSHEMGHHEESGEVAMPILQGEMGANPAQRVGIASTYAKRYALLAIIGLAPEDDEDGAPSKGPGVAMPSRESAAPAPAPTAAAGQKWVGLVSQVKEKKGETNGKPWTLFVIIGGDHTEFGTFDAKHAEFARQAGMSEVEITWEATKKGGKNVVSIEPVEGREPGDEEPGA